MQYNGIVRQEFDLAGKWRVWVNVGTTNTNLLMLKFQKEVSEDEKNLIKWIDDMASDNQSFQLWKDANIEWKLTFLKSGKALSVNEIVDSLTPELLNSHLSVGPDLTEYTISKLKETQKINYLKFRERRLLNGNFTKINSCSG